MPAHLFSPIKIRDLTLKNRIVMPPMALDIAAEEGEVTPRLVEHYTSRARGHRGFKLNGTGALGSTWAGVGLVIVEHAYVSPDGKAHSRQLGIYDDRLIPGLSSLAKAVHQEGAPIGIQISHAGAKAIENPKAPSSIPLPFLPQRKNAFLSQDNSKPSGPQSPDSNSPGNAEQATVGDKVPQQFTEAELMELAAQFAQAARRAQRAGFDLVEIHGAHGYLLDQFYSPLTNKRTDAYSGDLENRLRFPLQVVRAVREAVGPAFPILYRLGADDRMPGGATPEDSRQAVPLLVNAGADAIDLSGGLCGYLTHGPEGFFLYLAEAIKPVVKVPVMVTGGIKGAAFADRIIRQGLADLVGIGRALLKDPQWAQKAWKELNPA